MALPAGTISISDINLEQGNAATRNVSLGTLRDEWYAQSGDVDFAPGGSISMSSWREKSWTKPFTFKISVALSNYTLRLPTVPTGYTYNYHVDWGDGTSSNVTTSTPFPHVYETPGEYIIQIRGLYPRQDSTLSTSFQDTLREVLIIGDVGFERMSNMFEGCYYLSTVGPIEKFLGTSVDNMFYEAGGNGNLTVSEDLFKNCPNILDFSFVFAYSSLSGSIPANLFRYCTAATNFVGAFEDCLQVTFLPTSLFDYNHAMVNANYLFYNCENMEGTAPALWNRPGVSGVSAFKGCTKLSNYSSIPPPWDD